MIIAITGKKGTGKSTVANILVELGWKEEAYARPMKEGLKVLLDMTDEQLYGDIKAKETVDERYGVTPRHALQTIGTEWGRTHIHEDVWALKAHDAIKRDGGSRWVISDLRFLNEARVCKENGGIIVRVDRDGIDTGQFEDHQSETEIPLIDADYVIHNDGTLHELKELVEELLDHINDGVHGDGDIVPFHLWKRHDD